MRTRRPSPQQREAASRRLAQLEWWADHTRVSPARSAEPPGSAAPLPDPDPSDEPELRGEPEPRDEPEPRGEPEPLVPRPGRHAAPSRAGRVVEALVPVSLRGRVGLGAAQLTIVAVLVAVGMAVTAWLVVRSDPEPVGVVAASGESAAPLVPLPTDQGSAAPSTGSASPASGSITVDVAGKVRRPGIAVLEPGARVVDAIKAAGGAKRGVDTSTLNLARVLVDGEQILVGADPPPAVPGAPSAAATAPGELVNLNTATATELETLPQVGPVTAESIIAWRDEHGGFTAVEQLLEVSGIGEKTLAEVAPHVTV